MLRYPEAADAESLFKLAADPEVTRFFSWGPYASERQAADYIASLARKRDEGERLEFVVDNRDAGVIGITGLSEFSVRDRRAVIGTWLGREWWGTGANRGSKTLVLALAFGGLGLDRVTAWCSTDNIRSQAALDRLDFVREGILRRWHVHGGVPEDVVSYSMLREEWLAGGLAGAAVEIVGRIPRRFFPT